MGDGDGFFLHLDSFQPPTYGYLAQCDNCTQMAETTAWLKKKKKTARDFSCLDQQTAERHRRSSVPQQVQVTDNFVSKVQRMMR